MQICFGCRNYIFGEPVTSEKGNKFWHPTCAEKQNVAVDKKEEKKDGK